MYGSSWPQMAPYQPQQPYGQTYSSYQPRPSERPTELLRVTGIDGARAYSMPPNSTVALFDGGQDLMYIKSTDAAGFATIRTFSFQPYDNQAMAQVPINTADYATKADLQALREELMSYGKQPVRKQSKAAAEAADE